MAHDLPVYAPWIIFLPAIAAVIQQFWGKKLPRQGDLLVIGAMGGSLVLSIMLAVAWMGLKPGGYFHGQMEWMSLATGGADQAQAFYLGIMVDGLTAALCFVVTLVAFLVFLFSSGYMAGDAYYNRFFFWLSFFGVAMLILTLADNMLMLFIGWELVGLCSYKLIGFWSQDLANAEAAKKAFITTRIGDVGMMVGLLIIYAAVGSFQFDAIFAGASELVTENADGTKNDTLLTIAGVGIFLGAVGKSAQFPLQVWLPDAMAGPTPVSALIHAATMVAAGVYLAARMFPMFTVDALGYIAATGAITAFGAAIIAVVQTDIKKVLAYSTISQLGYMMIGIGCGAPWAGMFHLVTHAFFKACLFLGSGSVIHAMHHAQDLKDMGGLRKKMPVTFWTFVIATAALAGLPFTSGFLSKDAILASALDNHSYWIFGFGFAAAFLTAFYMTRMVWLCFMGEPRNKEKYDHAHESPWVMTLPLVILAVLSVGAWFGLTHFADKFFRTPAFWSDFPLTASNVAAYWDPAVAEHAHPAHPGWFTALALTLGPLGIAVGLALYAKGKRDEKSRVMPNAMQDWAVNLAYMDDLYLDGVVAGAHKTADVCRWTDENVVDGVVNATGRGGLAVGEISGDADQIVVDGAVTLTAEVAQGAGAVVSTAQTGRVRNYLAGAIGATAVAVVGVIFWLWIL
ncbi:MAG: NADH-quinone oxidoreductase subunit L [Planctomycetota bacterium]|jgi:NADH-quinone oxidoreductase subunit L